jgi:ATP-dependent Clp protease ATP-binding subunit ClpX
MRVISKSISLPSTLVCGQRSSRLLRFVRTQAQYEYSPREDYNLSEFSRPPGLVTPRQVNKLFTFWSTLFTTLQLAQYLDEYVVGQPEAKKVLSVA